MQPSPELFFQIANLGGLPDNGLKQNAFSVASAGVASQVPLQLMVEVRIFIATYCLTLLVEVLH